MKRKILAHLPYLAVLALGFYLLPLLIRDTGSGMLVLLGVMPLAVLSAAFVFGLRNGFSVWLADGALILFVPTIFIHYNESAWIYALLYPGITLAGCGIGAFIKKKLLPL